MARRLYESAFMKLRISGNSIRFRLSQSDVRRLLDTGSIEESASFGANPENRFSYALLFAPMAAETGAAFSNSRLTVEIPKDKGIEWAASEAVGIESVQRISGAGDMKILIEKDFACRSSKRRDEDSDAFPNPVVEQC